MRTALRFLVALAVAALLCFLECCGPLPDAPPPAAIASVVPLHCGPLLPVGDGYRDPALERLVPGTLCEPLATAEGLRCLPMAPYWDTGDRITDSNGQTVIPYPDAALPPIWVETITQYTPSHAAVSRVLLVVDGVRTCSPKGCWLIVPHPLSELTYALTSFSACTTTNPGASL